jgi:hypothetical protein
VTCDGSRLSLDKPARYSVSFALLQLATPKVGLWISFDNVTKLALSIPLAKCCTFALYPLKWLRFLDFAIYGHEGYISASKGGTEIDDYEANIEARSYSFVPGY